MNNDKQYTNPYYKLDDKEQLVQDTPIVQSSSTQPTQSSITNSLLSSFDTEDFLKGALIGAVGAYLLTNETAQKTIFKTVAKGTQMFQAGMEEIKERFEDAKAELEAEQNG